MYKAQEYDYRVFWSEADEAFVASAAEFPGLSHIDDDQISALSGMVDLVDFVLQDMQKNKEEAPVPLTKRHFSGKISLRITPEQHQRIALEAAQQAVSINQLLVSRV
ncbi:MAG: toxin-antitoxin system HicB family antitoxin [Raoultibacter sp.]